MRLPRLIGLILLLAVGCDDGAGPTLAPPIDGAMDVGHRPDVQGPDRDAQDPDLDADAIDASLVDVSLSDTLVDVDSGGDGAIRVFDVGERDGGFDAAADAAAPDGGQACALGTSEDCDPGCGSVGRRTCVEPGEWTVCVAQPEVCDGADQDCDGEVDEDFPCQPGDRRPCANGCGPAGTQVCGAMCGWQPCNALHVGCDPACMDDPAACADRVTDCELDTDGDGAIDPGALGLGDWHVLGDTTSYSFVPEKDFFVDSFEGAVQAWFGYDFDRGQYTRVGVSQYWLDRPSYPLFEFGVEWTVGKIEALQYRDWVFIGGEVGEDRTPVYWVTDMDGRVLVRPDPDNLQGLGQLLDGVLYDCGDAVCFMPLFNWGTPHHVRFDLEEGTYAVTDLEFVHPLYGPGPPGVDAPHRGLVADPEGDVVHSVEVQCMPGPDCLLWVGSLERGRYVRGTTIVENGVLIGVPFFEQGHILVPYRDRDAEIGSTYKIAWYTPDLRLVRTDLIDGEYRLTAKVGRIGGYLMLANQHPEGEFPEFTVFVDWWSWAGANFGPRMSFEVPANRELPSFLQGTSVHSSQGPGLRYSGGENTATSARPFRCRVQALEDDE